MTNHVKKYDVGQIKLDLPYANYIHELPLLSFGDVQHKINLSLVFNSARKVAEDNAFNIADGFKLNMQKRIVFENNAPSKLEESNGSLVDLFYTFGGYTFDDKSQRVLRAISNGYEIEYPDFSKETFNNDGHITAVYSKYDKTNPFLTFVYTNGLMTSIVYRNGKTINLVYNASNELISITYDNTTIQLVYDSNLLTVKHFSGVDYHLVCSNNGLEIYSADNEEDYSDDYSHRIICIQTDTSIAITRKIGSKIVDTITSDFLCFESEKIAIMDVTNKNGVKTRMHLKDKDLLYSYEAGLVNGGFLNNRYCGNVNINNVFNNESGVYTKCVQKSNDGTPMVMTDTSDRISWNIQLPTENEYDGLYIISGWIKLLSDNNSTTIELNVENGNNQQDLVFLLPKPPVGEWTYFSAGVYCTASQLTAYIKKTNGNVETKDFRIAFQQSVVSGATCIDDFTQEDDVLILEGTNGNPDKYLSPAADCQFFNGSTIIDDPVTMQDVLQYKINQMYGTHKNTIFYDSYRKSVTSAGALCVKYRENGTVYTVSVTSLAVGKRSYTNGKTHITKTNFYLDEDNNYSLITKSTINGVLYKEDVYNANLDAISSTVENAKTYYDYVSNSCGLISKQTLAPVGVDITNTARADVIVKQYNYDDNLTKLDNVVDEFGNTTLYTTDSTWGVVTSVTLPDGTVITDTYDDGKCALLSRQFSGVTNPRRTSFSYAGGNLETLTQACSNDSISFGYTYSGDKLASVKKGSNTIEEHEHTDTTLDSYYPTKAGKLYSVLSDFDDYGRLVKTDGLIDKVYDIDPEYNTSGDLITHSANASAVLATSTDLTNNQTTKYRYNNQRQVTKEEKVNSAGTAISEEAFEYDAIGRLTKDTFVYDKTNSKSVKTVILYEKSVDNPLVDNRPNRYSYYLDNASSPIAQTGYDFDDFNRIKTKFCSINGKEFTKNITYNKSRPRMLFEMLDGRPLSTTNYQYDDMGRISSVSVGGYTTYYTYDSYNQLVREDNQVLDKSFQYVYNGIGNIVSVKSYAYTAPTNELSGTPAATSFAYDNANPDRLISFNGKTIGYDAMGRTSSYDGYSYSWTRGKLSQISKGTLKTGSTSYSFTYNGNGQRTNRRYSYWAPATGLFPVQEGMLMNSNKQYHYDASGRLIKQVDNETRYPGTAVSRAITFLYDESAVVGMVYAEGSNTSNYYFQRNLQGDVVAIYDGNGAKVVEYKYDAWGNCTIAGTTTNYDAAHANPFRYRGYYYDEDTKLYYLNARYYSPEWRRFISPDDTAYLDPETPNGLNLYCYCGNEPLMNVDCCGNAYKRLPYFTVPFISTHTNSSKGISADSNHTIFGIPFEFGLVTPTKYPNDRMLTYAFYVKGNLGLHYSIKDGYSFLSLRLGIIDTTIKTDKFFGEDALINPNAFVDMGALNASVSVGVGISAICEVVSMGVGIQIGDVFSISLKGYLGAGLILDFTNGIEIGGGYPAGLILSINFDWLSLLIE